MRWTVALRALVLGLAFATLSTTHASASSFQVDVGFFYNDLAPHGRWVENVDYGHVWVPAVSASWRPYSLGHWVWTDDDGWLWVSDEDFGWATYHYGRWYEDPVYGWAWVPGYEWGPAWVSFREGGGYMGWAPLPPRVTWAAGFSIGPAEFDTFIQPREYCFVADRDFVAGSVRGRILPVARNVTIVQGTQNVTRFGVEGGRVVNRSVSLERVERATGRPVPHLRTVAVESSSGLRRERVHGNTVQVFSPAVRRTNAAPPGARAPERQTNPHDRSVSHGAATPRPEARSSQAWHEPPRSREAQKAQQQEAARLERAQRSETEAHQKEQARQLSEEKRYRDQLNKRQAQETKDMERAHDREIKHPQQAASAAEQQRQRQAEHQALEQRHSQQRQDFEASRQQAREAQARHQGQATAEARPQQQNHTKQEQNRPKENAQPKEKPKPKEKPHQG